MPRYRILVVGSADEGRTRMASALAGRFEVKTVASEAAAHAALAAEDFDAMITDAATLPNRNGTRPPTRNAWTPPVVVAAAGVNRTAAMEFMGFPVFEVLDDDLTTDKLAATVERAAVYGALKRQKTAFRRREGTQSLIGDTAVMHRLRETIRIAAPSSASVLIVGERGVGKETVAREIHRLSSRRDRPFVKVACAGVAENRLEEDLFGREHAPGVAVAGKIELASGGTLMLDDVGAAGEAVQEGLLRLMETGTIVRAGGARPVHADVRVISTGEHPLPTRLGSSGIRSDLFRRLSVVTIEVPPLRERRRDIPALVCHFVDALCRRYRRPSFDLTEGALLQLSSAQWPGNVRELESVVERAVVLSSGAVLDEDAFRTDGAGDVESWNVERTFRYGSIHDMERLMIVRRLADNDHNRTHAAKTLDISVRTLRNKLREYRESGLTIPDARSGGRAASNLRPQPAKRPGKID